MEILAQQPDESKDFVWLIPVLYNGRPVKFIRRPDGSDTQQIRIVTSDGPARIIPVNGKAMQFPQAVN